MQPPPIQQPIYDAKPAASPPPLVVFNKADMQQVEKMIFDAGCVKQVNSISAGMCLGFIVAAIIGPPLMTAPLACIAAGIALGGFAGNTSRSIIDCLTFMILLGIAVVICFYGVAESMRLQQLLNAVNRS